MEELLDLKQAQQVLAEEKGTVLCIVSQAEMEALQKCTVVSAEQEIHLSSQHLEYMEQKISGKLPARLFVVAQSKEETTAEERGLIYAMLLRCRKVISCRDKLEDMLYHQDEKAWAGVKEEYETKVLDLFKQTWRQVDSYPYVIVDNIKAYNKGEGYIMKALYHHLSERTPGMKNDGDAAMISLLKQMFEEISISLIKPDAIILGKGIKLEQCEDSKVYRLTI